MGQTASIQCEPYNYKFKDSVLRGVSIIDNDSQKVSSHRFTGIPYAQPTSDKHRFLKARPLPENYDYSGDYTQYKAHCPQGRPIVDDYDMYANPNKPTEDVTYLNIWVPAGEAPEGGWPVLVFIHGGWLQFGTPDGPDMRTLHGRMQDKYIFVSVGYRLNVFGFLSSKEVQKAGTVNCGFWDQRMGIEWVYDNISFLGGNPEKISLSGLSAGSYSTFLQLAYEVYHPEAKQIIKQVLCISNCPVMRQKTVEESQEQFDELCSKLDIPTDASAEEKLDFLRKVTAERLVEVNYELKTYYFRGITDGDFLSRDLFKDVHSGKYGALLAAKGVRLIFTETENETPMYAHIHTPEDLESLPVRLGNYYPQSYVEKLLDEYLKMPEDASEQEQKEHLRDVYGRCCSDFQVYAGIRTFLDKSIKGGFPIEKVHRYRTAYQLSIYANSQFKRHGVTHSFDMPLWWYAKQDGLTEDECELIERWIAPVQKLLCFKDTKGLTSPDTYYYLSNKGNVSLQRDPLWQWGLEVGDIVKS